MQTKFQYSINNVTPIIPLMLTTVLYTLLIMVFKSSVLVLPLAILLCMLHLNPIINYIISLFVPISLVMNSVYQTKFLGVSVWGLIFVTTLLYFNKLYIECNSVNVLLPISVCSLCFLYNKIDDIYKGHSIYINMLKGTVMFTITLIFSILVKITISESLVLGIALIILLVLLCITMTCYIINTITYDLNYTSTVGIMNNVDFIHSKIIGFINSPICSGINIILIFVLIYSNYRFNIKYTFISSNFIKTVVCGLLLTVLFTTMQIKSNNLSHIHCDNTEFNYNKFYLSITNLTLLSEVKLMISSKFCTNIMINPEIEKVRDKLQESIKLTRQVLCMSSSESLVINELLKSLKLLLINYFEILFQIEENGDKNQVKSSKESEEISNKITNINQYINLFIVNTSEYLRVNNR